MATEKNQKSFYERMLEIDRHTGAATWLAGIAEEHFGALASYGDTVFTASSYLAVVNTARQPENVRRGNDRVMRARLADEIIALRQVPRDDLQGIYLRLESIKSQVENLALPQPQFVTDAPPPAEEQPARAAGSASVVKSWWST